METTKKYLITILLLFKVFTTFAQDYVNNNSHVLKGYLKNNGGVWLDKEFSKVTFDNLFHNRLNYKWNISDNFSFATEGRNRVFYNPLIKDISLYAALLEEDNGIMDLSWVWMSQSKWVGHTMLDRLYFDYTIDNWQVRVGRQRVNWGINMVSNPNDLFNTYSFFDFDYPERPGSDALRIIHHLGFASRFEAAYSPAKDPTESTGAFLYALNYNGYDFQTIAGYYRNRFALGFGWAGSIGKVGFKGEGTWFYDIKSQPSVDRGNIVLGFGFDYYFSNDTYFLIELLYNGGKNRVNQDVLLVFQPLSPDNLMFSKYATTISAYSPISNLFQCGASVMVLPDIKAAFFTPNINYSLFQNFDIGLVAQVFVGEKNSFFGELGTYWVTSLKYFF